LSNFLCIFKHFVVPTCQDAKHLALSSLVASFFVGMFDAQSMCSNTSLSASHTPPRT